MIKHLLDEKDKDKNVIWNGCTYRSTAREVYLPEAVEMYNPAIEEKTDWKQIGIDAGLNEDELKKFMKKSVANRKKQLNIEG